MYYYTHFESLYKDTPKLAKPAQHNTRMGRMENHALELFGNPKKLLFSPLGRHNSASAKMWHGSERQEAMPTTTANMLLRLSICWVLFALCLPTAPLFRLNVPTFLSEIFLTPVWVSADQDLVTRSAEPASFLAKFMLPVPDTYSSAAEQWYWNWLKVTIEDRKILVANHGNGRNVRKWCTERPIVGV